MSLKINHNVSAINSHRNLQANQAEMSKTLERLSSGLKINRASEGPASLVISEQMRAQIAGLNQAIDNSETAVSLVQTTEANMAEISNLDGPAEEKDIIKLRSSIAVYTFIRILNGSEILRALKPEFLYSTNQVVSDLK